MLGSLQIIDGRVGRDSHLFDVKKPSEANSNEDL